LPSLTRSFATKEQEKKPAMSIRNCSTGTKADFHAGAAVRAGAGFARPAADRDLFHHGAFSVEDVMMTRNALMAYSVGLLGLILVKVLAPGFTPGEHPDTRQIALITLVVPA